MMPLVVAALVTDRALTLVLEPGEEPGPAAGAVAGHRRRAPLGAAPGVRAERAT